MKNYVMIFGMMIVSTIIFAQRNSDPRERLTHQADRMKTALALDDVQYKAVKAINEEYTSKLFQLRSDSALTQESKRQQVKALHQEKEDATKKVLTTEQIAKWTSYQEARKKKAKGHMKKSRGNHALRMQKDLSLTDEQTAQIKSLDQEFGAKFHALRKDSTMAREDQREQAKELRNEYQTKAKAVLTEEQLQKWEAQKAGRKKKK